jgi:hypothetical protein
MKNVGNGVERQNIYPKLNRNLNETDIPPFIKDQKQMIKHLSKRIGNIFLLKQKNRIDQLMEELKTKKGVN